MSRALDLGKDALFWGEDAQGWVVRLPEQWRGLGRICAPAGVAAGRVRLDLPAHMPMDATLVPALWALLHPLSRNGWAIDIGGLPASIKAPLSLALGQVSHLGAPAAASSANPTHHDGAQVPDSARASAPVPSAWVQARITLSFVGDVVLAVGRVRERPRVFRWSDVRHHMDQMGPSSLPIVSLTVFLVGLMLAYMGGAQLGRIGAQSFIADVVTVGVVRELAALMTGVILAGRIGAAIAAQLGTMTVNEEIDALRTLGIDPMRHLVLPRLLAMLLVAPLLIVLAMLVGILAGLPAAMWVYGVPAAEYLHKSLQALTWTHLWIGLFKGTMYALLVVIAGCREGLYVGPTAEAIGVATTRAVVKSLVWIVMAACGSTVVLQSLGF